MSYHKGTHGNGCKYGELQCPKAMQHSLFYDWLHYLSLFGLGGAIKASGSANDFEELFDSLKAS